jgi:hypothetical protein
MVSYRDQSNAQRDAGPQLIERLFACHCRLKRLAHKPFRDIGNTGTGDVDDALDAATER